MATVVLQLRLRKGSAKRRVAVDTLISTAGKRWWLSRMDNAGKGEYLD